VFPAVLSAKAASFERSRTFLGDDNLAGKTAHNSVLPLPCEVLLVRAPYQTIYDQQLNFIPPTPRIPGWYPTMTCRERFSSRVSFIHGSGILSFFVNDWSRRLFMKADI